MRMRRLSVLGLVPALLTFAVAGSASALPVAVALSDMSSDQTPASLLNAVVKVEHSGTSLKVTISNNTGGGLGAGSYNISEIWLNVTGETISSVSPAGAGSGGTSTGFDLFAPAPAAFGSFSTGFRVHGSAPQNPDLIVAGEQNVMVLLGCQDGDCSSAMLVNNANGKAVVGKFINGGNAYGDPDDSAFGASPVPEPATAVLLALGLIGLAVGSQRRDA